MIKKLIDFYNYCVSGVWKDPRNNIWVKLVKVANLSVGSFLNRGLQIKSMALTYSTVLAIVPAFALLFAIGRGFGFQNLLHDELFNYFPSQRQALETALSFVDSYLKQASQGVFVGIGIIVLLWTLISLLSNIEDTFNNIWQVKKQRSFYRKLTDYVALCLLVPIMMICSSGISIFISTSLQDNLKLAFLTPLVNTLLEFLPFILCWAAFAFSFFLIPNTKVKFKYAAISGIFSAIAFQVLQLLFVNGQIYVSKYNAIYGSFAFLPLLLIWLQLSWLILLAGSVVTYSLQNVYGYNYLGDTEGISNIYLRKLAIVITAIIIHRYEKEEPPLSISRLAEKYDLPIRLVDMIMQELVATGIVYRVIGKSDDDIAMVPAVDNDKFSINDLLTRLDNYGKQDFIPRFNETYSKTLSRIDDILSSYDRLPEGNTLLRDIPVPEIRQIVENKEDSRK